jgi:Fic family protein
LRREAQSTSALEGTFAPLEQVLADEDEEHGTLTSALIEVLNYVEAAEQSFAAIQDGHSVTVALLEEAQRVLVRWTPAEQRDPGKVRTIQVAIGADGPRIEDARFIPMPPGVELRAALGDLLLWLEGDSDRDPIIASAMSHYQFETLHPFTDGNGRIGRLLIVLQLMRVDALRQPLLSVSPWFEARRNEYQEKLYNVSAYGDWNAWIHFFSRGLEAAAKDTLTRVEELLELRERYQSRLQERLPRGGIAREIVDMLIGYPSLTVPTITKRLGRATPQGVAHAVGQLVEIGILERRDSRYRHRYLAPEVMAILSRPSI